MTLTIEQARAGTHRREQDMLRETVELNSFVCDVRDQLMAETRGLRDEVQSLRKQVEALSNKPPAASGEKDAEIARLREELSRAVVLGKWVSKAIVGWSIQQRNGTADGFIVEKTTAKYITQACNSFQFPDKSPPTPQPHNSLTPENPSALRAAITTTKEQA